MGSFWDDIWDGIEAVNRWTTLVPTPQAVSLTREGVKTSVPFRDEVVDPATGKASGLQEATARSSERFFQGVKYVRDNYISQPVSAFILQGKKAGDNPGVYFSASDWSRAWRAAEHISPGQAAFATTAVSADAKGQAAVAERMIASPLQYYAPPEAYLPEGWDALPKDEQQRILKEAGMPVVGNRYVEEMRNSSVLYKYGSGVGDFAMAWYTDPLVLAGKGAGIVRRATTVKYRPSGGWSPERIDQLVNSSRMTGLLEFLEKNADNPQLVNNTDFAMKTLGPRMGAINAVLKGMEERALFVRTGMGDLHAKAMLEERNALARARIQADESRIAAIDLGHAQFASTWDPRLKALVAGERSRLDEAVAADTAMVSRYEQILQHVDEIDQIHLSRWSFDRAAQRTAAQNQYAIGPGRGRKAARQLNITTAPPIGRLDPLTGTVASRDITSGFVKTRLWGVGDFFTTPVTLVRMMGNVKPNGYMSLDNGAAFDAANVAELRGQLARIPGISSQTRQDILNQYLKTASEGERRDLLDNVNRLGVAKIAKKHGLTSEAGREIYEAQRLKLLGAIDDMQQFSVAKAEGGLRVDAFEVEGGIRVAPHTVSRIMNSHIMPDLDDFNKIIARHASALKAIRESAAGNPDWILSAGEYLNHLWKFSTLFRLGYIARTMGDDLASQTARLGAAAMAMRVGYGVKNTATNIAHREERKFNELAEQMHLEKARYAQEELDLLAPEMMKLGGRVAAERLSRQQAVDAAQARLDWTRDRMRNIPTGASQAQVRALQRLFDRRVTELQQAKVRVGKAGSAKNVRLRDMELRQGMLEYYRNLSRDAALDAQQKMVKARQGWGAIEVDGVVFPAAFGGQRGDYTMQRISPTVAYSQLFSTAKQLIHQNLIRSFDNGARPISAIDDAVKHADAWSHAINAQIAGDQMQRMLVAGRSEAEVVKWLKQDPAGKAYWNRLGLKMADPEDIVKRAQAEVDDYLPLPEIRMQALTPEGVTSQFLQDAMPNVVHRPDVHMANVGRNPLAHMRAMDRVMQKFYDVANNIPSARLSRHPLFNQLYEGHLKTIVAQRAQQGAETKTVGDIERTVESARRLAERDMKRLVFDIAHKSDAAAALRFVSPFFAATAESFQRWGRVIADRPEVLGYASNFYNAPAYLGHMQDQDGNRIFPDGTVVTMDPETGKAVRKLASKADRWIVARMPKWLVNSPLGVALGVERSSGNVTLSQNSINMVTQGDPWFNPGVGPIVQIPVNEWVKDKPSRAEVARHLGILPFGPTGGGNPLSRAARQAAPATLRNFLTAFDTSDHRYQQVKMQVLQRAIYEHEVQGKRMLSAQEIADRTRNYWLFTAASSFTQPMATQRRDAFQYYRDQYNILRRQDPENADQLFLSKFGEDYFIFAQSMSKNVAGVPATKKAVELSKKYAGILSEYPELGPLIIGKEGDGPFSPEAYAYQLNTPLVPGDSEMQRRRLSAQEALAENQRRLGWAKFSSVMDWLNSQAVQRGLASLEDKGAEDLLNVKKAVVMMYGSPELLGKANPHYNAEWSQDYFSFDSKKYERLIPALQTVATDVLKQNPERGDMRTLLQYLQARKVIAQALAARQFHTLGARANSDLRQWWVRYVGTLTEQNTDFESLHHRYLSRDLGVDVDEEHAALEALEGVVA